MPSQDEVEEFAALLRGLKARTDRSYGALARRLGMNTSTLHRYCAGDTVPLDFASVERFAALCGATAAERVELHRCWILAVAARQRGAAAKASTTTAPAPQEAPPTTGPATPGAGAAVPAAAEAAPLAGTPVPAAVDAVPTAGAGVPAAAEAAPLAGTPVPVAAVTAPTAGTPVPAAAEAAPTAGAGVPAAVEAVPTPGVAVPAAVGNGPASGEAGLRPSGAKGGRYGRRFAVSGVVLAALCATVGGVAALSSGSGTTTADGGAASTGPADVRHRPSATGDGRSSGGPSASSPDAPPKATGDGEAPSGPSGPSGRSRHPSAGASSTVAPLAWSVDAQLWATGCDHDYVIGKAPRDVPPPPAPQDAGPWAHSQRAVHGGRTLVGISVQGRTDTAVVLEALRVRVVGRAEPVEGAVYSTGQGCGSDMTPRSFAVDLDKDRPLARPVPGSDRGTDTPAVRMPYKVSATDPEVLLVDARTADCDCRWYLELDWSSQGRTGTERVDDHGVPFRTSGTEGLPHYWYANRGWTPW
ncbi:helix-turn-helix domain-containing protein [Streptomyces fragilis]|uniref:Helix-turn-helix transcriptional regulator n=1 Tax=Streptomyces fragilis TaxID=67301 RepID=A0ABV2YKL8_9ACTN|nr:helix-turn-helix transcriptional regulator [Streptomyces fragilis]